MTLGQITDEGVARLRERIGIPVPNPLPPHYLCPTEDAFRHVAVSYGDDRPLWHDKSYAAATRWGTPIASPAMTGGDTLVGEDEVTAVPDHLAAAMKGDPLRGVHAFYAGSMREWWAPLRAGERVLRRNALVSVLDKPSSFAGRAIHEWTAHVFGTSTGVLLGAQCRNMIRSERSAARSRKRYTAVEPAIWTAEQLAEIDAAYARECPRGNEPRWWEDVAVGDELPSLAKGPLTITDMVCWHVGMGMGMYGVQPLRLAWKNRQRIPRFYSPNAQGVPDTEQRVHWDPEAARRAGNPTTFDYGRMRETWLIHCCTDWMGDDAWLWKLDCEFRLFNYVGDMHWITGRVVRHYLAEGGRPAVDLELAAVNQRGEITAPGHATILLPSHEHGPVRLPDPPGAATDLAGVISALSDNFPAPEPT
jgi:acyl dehydratase